MARINSTRLCACGLIALGAAVLAYEAAHPGAFAIEKRNFLPLPLGTAIAWAGATAILIADHVKQRARQLQRREMAALARCARRFESQDL
jgi:hypothetical protein